MSNLVYDFSDEFLNDENAIIVLDFNRNVYKPQVEHDGLVFVEKCLVRKGKYNPTALLTPSSVRANAFLVDEVNFQDVGGGLQIFERHYATMPTTWFDYTQVSYRTLWWGALNYRSPSGGGDSWDKTRASAAKATHYYFKKSDVPSIPVPDTETNGQDFVTDLTKTYTMYPQSRFGRRFEDSIGRIGQTIAIAPDRISVYMGDIYELVRYTIDI